MRTLAPIRLSFQLGCASSRAHLCTSGPLRFRGRGQGRALGVGVDSHTTYTARYRTRSNASMGASASTNANASTNASIESKIQGQANGTTPILTRERDAAVEAVCAAHVLTRTLQASITSGMGALKKQDHSPVTVADFATQAYIVSRLALQFPEDRFIAEESSDALRADDNLLDSVVSAANVAASHAGTELLTRESVLEAIDLCTYQGGGTEGERTWILDPIDGTIGYQNGRQYCIALGFLCDGVPSLGVLGCPALQYDGVRGYAGPGAGVVFHATTGSGAWMQLESRASGTDTAVRVRASTEQDPALAVAMTSVEAGHSRHAVSDRVAEILLMRTAPLRMDSQAKYGALSRGDAHVFLRMPRSTYVENAWDHAAGVVVLTEAGGKITDGRGRPLDFSKGRTLDNDDGIVATNGGALHDKVIAAVQQTLSELSG